MTLNPRRIVTIVFVNVMVLCLLLLVVEGVSSWALFTSEVLRSTPLAERLHTRYDPELGWANQPGVRLDHFYGKDRHLTITQRGFRGRAEADPVPAPGRVRVVCSGDSFTLGYGVDDQDTWCHRLSVLDPRFETINMGQGGYGVDQAYLWYRRESPTLKQHVHVFAVIAEDFRRMTSSDFLGYPKPVLVAENGTLHLRNVPVPQASFNPLLFINRHIRAVRSLRTVQFGQAFQRQWGNLSGAPPPPAESTLTRTREVVTALFRDLRDLNQRYGSRLVVMLLPTEPELDGDGPTEWAVFLHTLTAELGVGFVDLFDTFRNLAPQERRLAYIDGTAVSFPAAAGHFDRAGNEIVARRLQDALARVDVPPGAKPEAAVDEVARSMGPGR